ncbi:type II secretion system protein, partial [Salmonella enterica]
MKSKRGFTLLEVLVAL